MDHDTNDCTVMALANACRFSYEKSFDILKDMGRPDGEGFSLKDALTSFKQIGPYRFFRHDMRHASQLTVGDLAQLKPYGVFLVMVPEHATVVYNGKVLDRSPIEASTMQVLSYFRVVAMSPFNNPPHLNQVEIRNSWQPTHDYSLIYKEFSLAR